MSILAALPALLFGLASLSALAVLAVSGRRFIGAWRELSRALENCGEVRIARVTVTGTRPQLRLVDTGFGGAVSRRPAVPDRGLRAAA
jgi:hypothetical protein